MLFKNNIIIAGKNNIAVEVAEFILNEFPNLTVYGVFNRTDDGKNNWQRSFKKYCFENEIPSLELDECYQIDNALFLSLEFDRIIKPELFKSQSIFNLHFSLLPRYKGMYTSALPFLNGDDFSGVTLHEIDAGIDTGDIVAQESFGIDELSNSLQLYSQYTKFGFKLIKENFNSILQGAYKPYKQNAISSSYYSKNYIDYSSLSFNLNCTARELQNQVKAFSFRPFQLLKFNGTEISFCRITPFKSTLKTGMICSEDEFKYIVSTIDYDIELIKDKLSELLVACQADISYKVKDILQENPSILQEKNSSGWNAIIVAAYHGRQNIIDELIKLGADINSVNFNGTSVLMYAKSYCVENNHSGLLRHLITLGADPFIKDFKNKTIFDYVEYDKNCSVSIFLGNISK